MATKQELDEAVNALRDGKTVEVQVECGKNGPYSLYIVKVKDGALWVMDQEEVITGNSRWDEGFEPYPVTQDDEYKETILQDLEYLVLWGGKPSSKRITNVSMMYFKVMEGA
jgi:hypothetical protein